ncbi:MAG: GAF domain-containing protein [Desulfamplus sp.]|nr:GAF domain-containing protein [Desulfamplus sp.]
MLPNKISICVPESIFKNWQEIVDIMAEMLDVPAGLIMRLNDPYIEVFASSNSKGNPYHPGDKDHFLGSGLYCETVIKTNDKLLVPDALSDEQWKNNPDVKLNMISYLGFPILLPNKQPFGTICVLDKKVNSYSPTKEALIIKFRGIIESHLELIYMNQMLGDNNRRLSDYMLEIQAFRGIVPICSHCKSIKDDQDNWQPIEYYLTKQTEAEFSHGLCPQCIKLLYPEFAEQLL